MSQFVDFKQFKDNNSLHSGASLTKCKMHLCVIVIHISYNFHRILYICSLFKAEFYLSKFESIAITHALMHILSSMKF